MKEYEGLIYVLSTILWIVLFFIAKHYGERWIHIYLGITFILIGYGFVVVGIANNK